jgi:1-acyl-sn-glycerol-3-phosphate acyltransferase
MFAGWLRAQRMCHFGMSVWSRGILAVSGVRVTSRASEKFTREPCVFVANHQSAIDIPVLLSVLLRTHDLRFMAKESLFKIPFLGWGMTGSGFIPIRRENARQAAEAFMTITARHGAGMSYIIFPEGTRSPDGHMLEFKRGAVALVMRLKRALVPVTLADACRANPKGRLLVRAGTVRVIIHDPVLPDDAAIADDERAYRERLTQTLHDTIAAALPEDQRPCPANSPSA